MTMSVVFALGFGFGFSGVWILMCAYLRAAGVIRTREEFIAAQARAARARRSKP